MNYLGDMALGSTINFKFTTIATTGAPAQLAATTATTLSIYPQSSTTQITAGATLTTDFDGITGLNAVSIALTGGNGYTTANDFDVVLATGTVGGVNVIGYTIASFSIGNRMAQLGTGTISAATFGAGAITSTVLAAGAIHSTIFTTGAIVSTTFLTGAITATAYASGAIVATTFAAGAITSTVLAGGAIHSTIFTTGAIAATTFVAGAITSTVLAAGAIHSTIFTTAAIGATTFIAGAITSTTHATGAIVATTFAAGAITSTVLAGGAIHSTIFTTGAIAATTFIPGAITSAVLGTGAIHSTIFTTGAIVATTFAGVLPTNFSALGISATGLVNITSSIKQNTIATGFMFVMTDMTTHIPVAGLAVVGTRSLDGAAFGATTNSAASVGFGTYSIDLSAADTNARHIMYRFTNATADDLNIEVITQP